MSETVTPARGGDQQERKTGSAKRDGDRIHGASPASKPNELTSPEVTDMAESPSGAQSDAPAGAAETLKSTVTPRLPVASMDSGFAGSHEAATSPSESERNAVFSELVTGDQDVVGLVAYSIYKQNKHDFLVAFAQAKGREPTPIEVAAYIVGESTPRRLSIYRHLAEATLEGRGPDAPLAGAGGKTAARKKASAQGMQSMLLWAILAGVVVMLVYLFTRFGLTTG